ncbi:outer membrane protein assembly factor BamE [Aquicella lusitana]|uniref:Outer membrane protein assembly factor BamE n=1 Tax=Aquicella lusitana TaxID=254246 RepID=A0A370GX45_9COXI|nr:outer membrane protein assembly factor BamE [Aquicella lusitana]RDI48049.1 Beta-barrel assembly machine subunit BamE [Aquicella lusitana]VVC72934.1 Outer membrane protein assembly factor BamE [Aquicella lusitana]
MKKLISLVLISFFVTGCFFRVHKIDVDQGNIITEENVRELHKGMSQSQVKEIMGNPVLVNIFTPERMDYVYTLQKGHEKMSEKRLTLVFRRGTLQEIIQN